MVSKARDKKKGWPKINLNEIRVSKAPKTD